MPFDERFRSQLARRLSFTEKVLIDCGVDWTALRSGLAACDSWVIGKWGIVTILLWKF